MSWLKASDPLALLAIQAGQVPNPSQQDGAAGGGRLDTDQRSIEFGEPVPIVFARRRNGAGGILISPGASECRFENNTSNAVTASYLLVLSEGRMDSIRVKDVFQRACRVGSHTQTYNRRAGRWLPGNYIVERDGYDKPEASYICGSIGLYPGITTLSFRVTIPDGFDQWKRQVHIFIRGGMWVTRLTDGVTGSSDNFADLVRWMLINSSRVPSALIDTAAFTSAATFLEANQFRCNCWIRDAQNYSDFITGWAPYFLLGESNVGGKKGLRPLLPVNNDGTLKTTAIDWEYIFTEDTILPGTFEIEYTSWADRQPFVAQMTWRQELDDDAAIIRTAEVRFINTAETGPYESHDLSEFCTTELHAVKVGAYILARRTYVTHTVRFAARPQAHNRLLTVGDIVRVKLSRQATGGGQSSHDYLYQVERIGKTLAGDVSYECSHFPVDDQGRSIVSLLVTNATGTGILLDTNSSGVGCDVNSPTDNTIPTEEFIIPGDDFDTGGIDTGTDVSTDAGAETVIDDLSLSGGGPGGGGGSGPSGDGDNPGDPLDEPTDPLPLPTGAGGPLGLPNCMDEVPGGSYQWYRKNEGGDYSPIPGADDPCYPPGEGDAGVPIRGCVTVNGVTRCTPDFEPGGTTSGLPENWVADVKYLYTTVVCQSNDCLVVEALTPVVTTVSNSFELGLISETPGALASGCIDCFGFNDPKCSLTSLCYVNRRSFVIKLLGTQISTVVATVREGEPSVKKVLIARQP